MEKFHYQANHLAKYRAKMAVKILNREVDRKYSLPDLLLLLSALILLLS
jgi:hypothetical protein